MRDQLRSLYESAGSPPFKQVEQHAQRAGYSVSKSALAAVISPTSAGMPRWSTVEAFIRACISYARANRRKLSDDNENMTTWRERYDNARHTQSKGKSSGATESDSPEKLLDYDVRKDGLFRLGIWSPNRKLSPGRLHTETVEFNARPSQPYIDERALVEAVRAKSLTASGETVYLTGFRIDHRESDETQYCQIRQAPSIYPEVLAIEELRVHYPQLFDECDRAIERDVREYLANAVPSSAAVNLVVLSAENDELLCVERSAAVDSGAGWWTVGVFETMKQGDPNRPGSAENIYTLGIRGLNEELGLEAVDYHPLQISWLGIYKPSLRGHVVAAVKLRISKAEAMDRIGAAHSGYEHAVVEWIPLRQSLIQAFVEATNTFQPRTADHTFDVNGRTWIEQSRLAVMEAWRFRNALES